MTDLEKAEEYLNLGNENYQTGNCSAAIVDYNKAIKLNPGFAEAYFRRGNAKYELAHYPDAIVDYNKSIELNPNSVAPYNNRGNAHNKVGDQLAASRDFRKALELDSEFAPAYYNLGYMEYCSGRYIEAIEYLTTAIQLNSEFAGSYYSRGSAYARIGKNAEAALDFITLIKCTRDLPDEYNGSSKCLYKYIPINQHQILSLINQELYFSAYQQLNDPLECFFVYHEESEFGQSLKRQKITTRICALTYQPGSKLMYSHYADAHQGLCVEYELDFERLNDEDLISYGNVTYGEKDRVGSLNDLYLLKNSDWKYEEEYRLVRFDNKEFQPAKIISITFAFRCSDDHRKIIYGLSKHHSNITYWEMRQKNNTNDLERVQIDDAGKYSVDDPTLFKLMLKHAFQDIHHYFQNHR